MISLINHFTIVFLCVLATNALVQWWLANRHLRHVLSHRNEVPEAFADNISLETHQSAADYTVAKVRVGMLDYVIGTVLLLLWTLGGGLDLLNGLWRDLALSPVWAGSGFILSAFFIFGLLDLPMSAYRTFVIEERFGFNKTTVGVFLIDLVKQGLVLLALGLPLVTAILWLMHEAGRFWWLYAWCLWGRFLCAADVAVSNCDRTAFQQIFTPRQPRAGSPNQRVAGEERPQYAGCVRDGRLASLGAR